ncbi:MAG: hypothetical protein CME65_14280 [Halobacteriovoraceae bacterium]|nr:hypothetical protein [Halobacteriovoraceae bacterium]
MKNAWLFIFLLWSQHLRAEGNCGVDPYPGEIICTGKVEHMTTFFGYDNFNALLCDVVPGRFTWDNHVEPTDRMAISDLQSIVFTPTGEVNFASYQNLMQDNPNFEEVRRVREALECAEYWMREGCGGDQDLCRELNNLKSLENASNEFRHAASGNEQYKACYHERVDEVGCPTNQYVLPLPNSTEGEIQNLSAAVSLGQDFCTPLEPGESFKKRAGRYLASLIETNIQAHEFERDCFAGEVEDNDRCNDESRDLSITTYLNQYDQMTQNLSLFNARRNYQSKGATRKTGTTLDFDLELNGTNQEASIDTILRDLSPDGVALKNFQGRDTEFRDFSTASHRRAIASENLRKIANFINSEVNGGSSTNPEINDFYQRFSTNLQQSNFDLNTDEGRNNARTLIREINTCNSIPNVHETGNYHRFREIIGLPEIIPEERGNYTETTQLARAQEEREFVGERFQFINAVKCRTIIPKDSRNREVSLLDAIQSHMNERRDIAEMDYIAQKTNFPAIHHLNLDSRDCPQEVSELEGSNIFDVARPCHLVPPSNEQMAESLNNTVTELREKQLRFQNGNLNDREMLVLNDAIETLLSQPNCRDNLCHSANSFLAGADDLRDWLKWTSIGGEFVCAFSGTIAGFQTAGAGFVAGGVCASTVAGAFTAWDMSRNRRAQASTSVLGSSELVDFNQMQEFWDESLLDLYFAAGTAPLGGLFSGGRFGLKTLGGQLAYRTLRESGQEVTQEALQALSRQYVRELMEASTKTGVYNILKREPNASVALRMIIDPDTLRINEELMAQLVLGLNTNAKRRAFREFVRNNNSEQIASLLASTPISQRRALIESILNGEDPLSTARQRLASTGHGQHIDESLSGFSREYQNLQELSSLSPEMIENLAPNSQTQRFLAQILRDEPDLINKLDELARKPAAEKERLTAELREALARQAAGDCN